VIGDEGAEICLGIEAAQLGGFDDGVHDGGAVTGTVSANECPVVPTDGQGPDGTLSGVGPGRAWGRCDSNTRLKLSNWIVPANTLE